MIIRKIFDASAIGIDDKNSILFLIKRAFIRCAKIRPKVIREINERKPLQGAPMEINESGILMTLPMRIEGKPMLNVIYNKLGY